MALLTRPGPYHANALGMPRHALRPNHIQRRVILWDLTHSKIETAKG